MSRRKAHNEEVPTDRKSMETFVLYLLPCWQEQLCASFLLHTSSILCALHTCVNAGTLLMRGFKIEFVFAKVNFLRESNSDSLLHTCFHMNPGKSAERKRQSDKAVIIFTLVVIHKWFNFFFFFLYISRYDFTQGLEKRRRPSVLALID